MFKMTTIPYQWMPVDPRIADRLEAVLYPWRNTPYMLGQRSKGQGVDCVNFLVAVLLELYDSPAEFAAKLGPLRARGDRSMHNPEEAERTKQKILDAFQPHEQILSLDVEPGDILITGPKHGGPGHAMIVTPFPGVLIHATQRGVQTAGCGFLRDQQRPFEVWRLLNKDLWIQD